MREWGSCVSFCCRQSGNFLSVMISENFLTDGYDIRKLYLGGDVYCWSGAVLVMMNENNLKHVLMDKT